MGLTLYLGIERGNIACHKSEVRFGTLLREGRLASRAFRDEAFWRNQVNFGPPNPATDEKALWYGVKGSVYVVTLPAFLRCLEDGPDAAERRPRSGFPTGGGAGDGHLKAHHDLQATPARPGKATRLGVIGSINALLDLYSRKLYRQQRARVDPGLTFHYFFHDERTASASVEVVEGPLGRASAPLSKRYDSVSESAEGE
ncbi:hypothetical protein L1987_45927 [Smallanthus sonchifolius]|uniref:Uncharacterized protein n=1 Tax=Smallanthus sonchifolius TaxID=185202 RepID=A0ACB9FYY4_9ASTR|nr:hypothetical protein L1987_45927 [Smallanthus sonchifolius]